MEANHDLIQQPVFTIMIQILHGSSMIEEYPIACKRRMLVASHFSSQFFQLKWR